MARPETPGVASEPNTDGGGGGGPASSASIGGMVVSEGIHSQPEDFDEEDVCPPSCKVSKSYVNLMKVESNLFATATRVACDVILLPKKKSIYLR